MLPMTRQPATMIGGIAESRRAIDCNVARLSYSILSPSYSSIKFLFQFNWIGIAILSLDNEIIDVEIIRMSFTFDSVLQSILY